MLRILGCVEVGDREIGQVIATEFEGKSSQVLCHCVLNFMCDYISLSNNICGIMSETRMQL